MVAAVLSGEPERSSDRWRTPEPILHAARRFVGALRSVPQGWCAFDLDPCTESDNPTRAARIITREEDGLVTPWALRDGGLAWVNCPYSAGSVLRWVERLRDQVPFDRPVHALLLVQADQTTQWHRLAVMTASALLHVGKRVPFIDPSTGKTATGARFCSDLFYVGDRPHLFADVFRDAGYCEVLR